MMRYLWGLLAVVAVVYAAGRVVWAGWSRWVYPSVPSLLRIVLVAAAVLAAVQFGLWLARR